MTELIIADLHIDASRELSETIKVLDFIVEQAIINKVVRVAILGDIYDKKHPNSEERMVFQKFIMKLIDSNIEVLLIIGNHDLFALKVVEKGSKHYSFGEFEILRVKRVTVVSSGYKEDGIYYGHFPIGEAKLGDYDMSCFNKNVITTKELLEANPECNLFILGDIHKGQMVYSDNEKKVLYVGSPERITWGERSDKKVILIRDGLKLKSIATPIRKWVQIEEDWTEKQHIADEPVKEDIDDVIVKLIIKTKKGMGFVVREDFIRERYAKATKLIIVYDIIKAETIRNKDISESKSVTECFLEYCKEKEYTQEITDEGIRIIKGEVT